VRDIADDPQYRLHKGLLMALESCKWVQPFPRARGRLAPQGDNRIGAGGGQHFLGLVDVTTKAPIAVAIRASLRLGRGCQ